MQYLAANRAHIIPIRATVCCRASASNKRVKRDSAPIKFCGVCGDHSGLLPCGVCGGSGYVSTEAGGAGKPFYVGSARCSFCNGMGEAACPLCAGHESSLPAKQSRSANRDTDHDAKDFGNLSWLDEL